MKILNFFKYIIKPRMQYQYFLKVKIHYIFKKEIMIMHLIIYFIYDHSCAKKNIEEQYNYM